MPFISKDWRSPGEEWVKTEEGWEKKKILECGRQIIFMQTENSEPRCLSITAFDQNNGDIKIQGLTHNRCSETDWGIGVIYKGANETQELKAPSKALQVSLEPEVGAANKGVIKI